MHEQNHRWCPQREDWVPPNDPMWPYLPQNSPPEAFNTTNNAPEPRTFTIAKGFDYEAVKKALQENNDVTGSPQVPRRTSHSGPNGTE